MYFVGIDISKFKHDCAVFDELGDVVTPSWSFSNDCEGFSLLKELLTTLHSDIKIGVESTGHYGQNLKLFLESNGFTFMEFNPLLISRFVHSKSLRKTKTDSIDARIIAQYLMTVEYKPYPTSFYHLDKLKSLTGYYQSGQSEQSGRMVKHGSSHLRCALMNCCLPVVSNESVFAEYYTKKRAEGKPHRVAMTHVAKKLLRIIFTLQTKNVPYNADLIR